MGKHFYVTDGMNKIGPFTKEEVLRMLYSAHISLMDYIVDARDGRMCPLMQHEDFASGSGSKDITEDEGDDAGPSGVAQPDMASRFNFKDLKTQTQQQKADIRKQRSSRKEAALPTSPLKQVMTANPELAVTKHEKSVRKYDPIVDEVTVTVAEPLPEVDVDEDVTTTTMKTNSSVNFYLKVKNKEYGPLKFLLLLSLIKQNKLTPQTSTRTESETEWHPLSDYLPKELQQTIQITPMMSPDVLPKNLWKRKNLRVDYEEIVLVNNPRYSLVGKSVDLSPEGIAVIWVYDVPVNEEFELSIFDIDKNVVNLKGRLSRKQPLVTDNGITFYKAVFLFKERIQLKNFVA